MQRESSETGQGALASFRRLRRYQIQKAIRPEQRLPCCEAGLSSIAWLALFPQKHEFRKLDRVVQQRTDKIDIHSCSASAALYGIREYLGRIIFVRPFCAQLWLQWKR